MASIILLLICIVGVYLELTASTTIDCEYQTQDWNIVENVYQCTVQNDPDIRSQESATITSVTGNHQSGKTNSDVEGFQVWSKTYHFFPRGLEAFFNNLKVIQIANSYLQEVHQEDLKPFPKLVELYLYPNFLQVLEEGLFDFNPNLQIIHLSWNKIVHIEPNVFDHLSNLRYLLLRENTCINEGASNSISEVKNIIQAVKYQCISSSHQ